MTPDRDPFGRDRSERLTDHETAERMLATGVRRVQDEGLRISFDLLRFEELIVEASVARSAVYRRWPTKHHYYADLLRRLAAHQFPAAAAYRDASVAFIQEHVDRVRVGMATQDGRRQIAVELCRVLAQRTFELLTSSPNWKVYLTLTATVATLPTEGSLQTDLRTSLREAEAEFFTEMAEIYEMFMTALGHRLRPDLPAGVSLQAVARIGLSILEGLSLHDITTPDATGSWRGDPFDAGEVTDWTPASIGFTSAMTSLFEIDPDQGGDWDDQMVEDRCQVLHEMTRKFRQ